MKTYRQAFIIRIATFCILFFFLEKILTIFGPARFLPEQKFKNLLSQGQSCIYVTGDSVTVAGISHPLLERELKKRNVNSCVSMFAVGGLNIDGLHLALRRYLDLGFRPKAIVVGNFSDDLLYPFRPILPSAFHGAGGILYSWGKFSDVWHHYPRFPLVDLDAGIRFMTNWLTSYGAYLPSVWIKVGYYQDKYILGKTAKKNEFGALRDFKKMADEQLNKPMLFKHGNPADGWREHHSFIAIKKLAQDHQIPVYVVQLPQKKRFYRFLYSQPKAKQYRTWLGQQLEINGGALIDLSQPVWIKDSLFKDEVHLSSQGRDKITREIAAQLAPLL